ncbi:MULTISPECIES: porin family protein [unclassified Olleya]|jgi:opacity protein-like surface antigen|uniref:porin family protein n=1 Tax=unclassified Olleya TaxID=2615019 RepID=UPI00164494B8|nr:porin family protein [Olleya sp. Hel_I_94]
MKKPKNINYYLILTFLFTISSQLYSQNIDKKNVFGIMAGGNISNISNYEGKSSLGFSGGLYWEWKFSNKFSLQSNILYSQRGENKDGNFSDLKLDYINMPILLKYYATEKLGVMTGVYMDFLLNVDSSNFDKDDFKQTDLGIPIGVSYDLSKNLQLGLSYNIGLTDILDNNPNSDKLTNNWGNFSLTYIFK